MKRRWNINIPFLIVSIFFVVASCIFYYYPKLQGELNTNLDAVYLDDLNPVYDYDSGLISFSKEHLVKDKKGASVEKGININFTNGSGSSYKHPKFNVKYKINSKFDKLTGKLVFLECKNIKDKIIEVKVIADKSTIIYQTKWDFKKQPVLTLDVPLNKVRIVEIDMSTAINYKGDILKIGLTDLVVTKGTARPQAVIKKGDTENKSNFTWSSLLLLPKPVNNVKDTQYIKIYKLTNSTGNINFAGNSEIYTTNFSGKMSFQLLNNNINDPLRFKATDIKLKGCVADITLENNNHVTLNNIKATDKRNISIYIPKGTVISRDGYSLRDDFIIKNVTIVSSNGIGVFRALQPYRYAFFIIVGLLLLIMLIEKKLINKSNIELPMHSCVINITICIVLSFVVFGIPGLLENSFGRGGYENDIGLLIFIFAFTIPCGTAIIYRFLMTWRYNIRSNGIVGGTFAFIFQIILTFTGIYLISMLLGGAILGSIEGTKAIMRE